MKEGSADGWCLLQRDAAKPPAEPGCPGLLGQTRLVLRASFCPFVFPSGHSYLERLLNVEVPQKVR